MVNPVVIAGVGKSRFITTSAAEPYKVKGPPAVRLAHKDAAVSREDIDQLHASNLYRDSAGGQKAACEFGTCGIPIFNVNKNCIRGLSAQLLAGQVIASNALDPIESSAGSLVMCTPFWCEQPCAASNSSINYALASELARSKGLTLFRNISIGGAGAPTDVRWA
jgi:hypothetical protein